MFFNDYESIREQLIIIQQGKLAMINLINQGFIKKFFLYFNF